MRTFYELASVSIRPSPRWSSWWLPIYALEVRIFAAKAKWAFSIIYPLVSLFSINVHNPKTISIEKRGNNTWMSQHRFCKWVLSMIRISYSAHCKSSTPKQFESLAQAANASPRFDFSPYTCPPQFLATVLTNVVGQGSK